MLKILITDDHSIVRKGIHQILIEEFPTSMIEEAYDSQSMIEKIKEKKWDIVISDLSMPGKSGLETIPLITQLQPNIPILIMSIHPAEQYALRVLKLGASGYLNKDSATEELILAIKNLLDGKKYITPTIEEKLIFYKNKDIQKPLHELLSDREFEVFKFIAIGRSISEIAETMNLNVTTVSTYRSRLLSKMNFSSNAEITLYCVNHKIIDIL